MSGVLPFLRGGEKITADQWNKIVSEIHRIANIKASPCSRILITNTSSGIYFDLPPRFLTIDDKYRIDEKYNQSELIKRLCDEKLADIADVWRIRAVVSISSGGVYSITMTNNLTDRQKYKLMWLINRFGEQEGGWLTDAAQAGLDLTAGNAALHEVAPPPRRTAQIGDIVILTDDDKIADTDDGDIQTYANIRHDAHFHKAATKDGRIYFSNDPPGAEGAIPFMGAMICDPALANLDTELKKESGQWRPQIKLPVYTYVPVPDNPPWFPPPPNDLTYQAPPIVNLKDIDPWSVDTAYMDFIKSTLLQPALGPGSINLDIVPTVPATGLNYPLRMYLEWHADNDTGVSQIAVFKMDYRVVPIGGNIRTAVQKNVELKLYIGSAINDINIVNRGALDYIEFAAADIASYALIVIEHFYRDGNDMHDSFAGSVYVSSFKMAWGET